MTSKEFFYLVVEMRNAQKSYFRTRDQNDLQKSKQLEKQIDNEIRRVKQLQIEPELPLLY
jgi:hypothetical protein